MLQIEQNAGDCGEQDYQKWINLKSEQDAGCKGDKRGQPFLLFDGYSADIGDHGWTAEGSGT